MTADPNPNELPAVLEQLRQADPTLLRSMLTAFVQAVMSADAHSVCSAEFGSRCPDRTNRAQDADPGHRLFPCRPSVCPDPTQRGCARNPRDGRVGVAGPTGGHLVLSGHSLPMAHADVGVTPLKVRRWDRGIFGGRSAVG